MSIFMWGKGLSSSFSQIQTAMCLFVMTTVWIILSRTHTYIYIYIFLYVGLQYNIHLLSPLLTCTGENTHTMGFHGCYRTAIKMGSMPTEQSKSVEQLSIVTKSWFTLLTFTHLTFKAPFGLALTDKWRSYKDRGAVRKREKCELWTTGVETEGKTLLI